MVLFKLLFDLIDSDVGIFADFVYGVEDVFRFYAHIIIYVFLNILSKIWVYTIQIS